MTKTIRLDFFSPTIKQDVARLPDKMLEGANEAINEAAELILGLAQINVRVDKGDLRDSGRIERKANRVSVVFGNSQVNYARIIEERYPFLRPSYLAVLPQVRTMIENKVVEKVER